MKQKPDQDRVARFITESAHQIYMLSLDALSQTEKESRKFFDTMWGLGAAIQSQSLKTAGAAKQTVTGGKMSAADTLERIEQIFELRVARVLNALQIPTAKDIKELSARVDSLSQAVERLNAEKGVPKKSSSKPKKRKSAEKKIKKKKNAAKKSAARKKTTKKPATRKTSNKKKKKS